MPAPTRARGRAELDLEMCDPPADLATTDGDLEGFERDRAFEIDGHGRDELAFPGGLRHDRADQGARGAPVHGIGPPRSCREHRRPVAITVGLEEAPRAGVARHSAPSVQARIAPATATISSSCPGSVRSIDTPPPLARVSSRARCSSTPSPGPSGVQASTPIRTPRSPAAARTAAERLSIGPSTTARTGRSGAPAGPRSRRRPPTPQWGCRHEGRAEPSGGEGPGHPVAGRAGVGATRPPSPSTRRVVLCDERGHQRHTGGGPAGLGHGGQPWAQRGELGEGAAAGHRSASGPRAPGGTTRCGYCAQKRERRLALVHPGHEDQVGRREPSELEVELLEARRWPSGAGSASGRRLWRPRC